MAWKSGRRLAGQVITNRPSGSPQLPERMGEPGRSQALLPGNKRLEERKWPGGVPGEV